MHRCGYLWARAPRTATRLIWFSFPDPSLARSGRTRASAQYRLRALVPDAIDDPLRLVTDTLEQNNIQADTQIAGASLEDVFVAATLKPKELTA